MPSRLTARRLSRQPETRAAGRRLDGFIRMMASAKRDHQRVAIRRVDGAAKSVCAIGLRFTCAAKRSGARQLHAGVLPRLDLESPCSWLS